MSEIESVGESNSGVSRRVIVQGAAWSIPVIAAAAAVPTAAASGALQAVLAVSGSGCIAPGTALTDPAASVTVSDASGVLAGATVELVFTSADGGTVIRGGQSYPGSSVTVQGTTNASGAAVFTGVTAGTQGTVSVLARVRTADGRTVDSNVGSYSICAPVGNVFVWGYNAEGQIGNSTGQNTVPTAWNTDKKFTSIAGSWSTLAAVSTENTVYSSGINGLGERGTGTTGGTTFTGPAGPAYSTDRVGTQRTLGNAASFPTFTTAKAMVGTNGYFDETFMVYGTDGNVYAVGENPGDQFSKNNGTNTDAFSGAYTGYTRAGSAILAANPGKTITQVDIAGWWRSVYLLSDGTVWNAGRNHLSSFGSGNTPAPSAQGVAVQTLKANGTPLTGIVEVRMTQDSAVYLDANGTLWAAGNNTYGQLPGFTNGGNSRVAVQLTQPAPGVPVTRLWKSASDGDSVIVMLADGRVFAAGNNTSGQLGIGTTARTNNAWVQIPLPAGKALRDIALGNDGGLYLMTDGSVYFAGANDTGGRGNNTTGGYVTSLTQVPLGGPATAVAATFWDTYAAIVP